MSIHIIFSFSHKEHLNCQDATIPLALGELETRKFPDQETYLRIKSNVSGKKVILYESMANPDPNFLKWIFFAETVKALGAVEVGFIAPYLAYMRQDTVFHAGECLSSKFFAQRLSAHFDWLMTVDPHLHRYHELSEIYTIPTICLQATSPIAHYIKTLGDVFLVGPDSESRQWVEAVASVAQVPFSVLTKKRLGDKSVEIQLTHHSELENRQIVILDDIISSARTMEQAIYQLQKTPNQVLGCVGVHGIFAEDAYERLKATGVSFIVTCNSISHPSNQIDLSSLLLSHIPG